MAQALDSVGMMSSSICANPIAAEHARAIAISPASQSHLRALSAKMSRCSFIACSEYQGINKIKSSAQFHAPCKAGPQSLSVLRPWSVKSTMKYCPVPHCDASMAKGTACGFPSDMMRSVVGYSAMATTRQMNDSASAAACVLQDQPTGIQSVQKIHMRGLAVHSRNGSLYQRQVLVTSCSKAMLHGNLLFLLALQFAAIGDEIVQCRDFGNSGKIALVILGSSEAAMASKLCARLKIDKNE